MLNRNAIRIGVSVVIGMMMAMPALAQERNAGFQSRETIVTLGLAEDVQPGTTVQPAMQVELDIKNDEILSQLTFRPLDRSALFEGDILSAKVYYTGESKTFVASRLLGEMTPVPGDEMVVPAHLNLSPGKHIFWLAYDIGPNASPVKLDVECVSLVLSNREAVPSFQKYEGALSIVVEEDTDKIVLLENGASFRENGLSKEVADGASNGATYMTTTDNVGQGGSGSADGDMDVRMGNTNYLHPVEFNINVTGALPTTSAVLTIYGYDVDEEQGEVNHVYFNGHFAGQMHGENGVWNTTVFNIPISWVKSGNNLVEYRIDMNNPNSNWWLSEVDWGQLLIDGGAGTHVRITDVRVTGSSTSGSNTLISTNVDIDVSTAGSYRYEINLVNPAGNTLCADSYTYTESSGSNSRNFTVSFPTSSQSGTYEIQVSLFQVSTGIQESYEPQAYYHSSTSAPEILVKGNSFTIDDGSTTPLTSNFTDFGTADCSGPAVVHEFVIENLGTLDLNLTGTSPYVAVSGTNAGDFTVTAVPSTPISQYGSTTFQVTFLPTGTGTRSASLSIANNDSDEDPYNFSIQGTGTGTVPSLLPIAITDNASNITHKSATLNGTVNANNRSTTVSFEWGTTQAYGNTLAATPSPVTGSGNTAVSAELTGLTYGSEYWYRVVATSSEGTTYGDAKYICTSYPDMPTATTDSAAVTATTATLYGTVDPKDASTVVTFTWGNISMPNSVAAVQSPIEGTTPTVVNGTITGLTPGTKYYYRVKANNGNEALGSRKEFTTMPNPPSVTTDAASADWTDQASLNGTFSGNGGLTQVSFEYGLDINYGSTVSGNNVWANESNVSRGATATGLTPNTTYHYRAVGTNAGGTTFGDDVTFTTKAVTPTVSNDSASVITTTGATLNGTVNANNASTTVLFQYGTDNSTFPFEFAADQSPVTGMSDTHVTKAITGLQPNTRYYYRIKTENAAGVRWGYSKYFDTVALPPAATTHAASAITISGATLNGSVNANGASTTVTFEYGLTDSYGSSVAANPGTVTGSTATTVSQVLTGLTGGATYHYRVVAVNAGGTTYGDDMIFKVGLPPTAVTDAALPVGTTDATLNGTVNAHEASTTVTFEYGLTDSYGSTATAAQSPLSGSANMEVSGAIANLMPNQTYHYRVAATSVNGTAYGADMTFTTAAAAPTATTDAASGIGTTVATLKATVNANNATTTLCFDYGITDSYGSTATPTPESASGTSSTTLTAALSGLLPNQTYHYRVKANNSGGTTYGADMTFTTSAAAPVATTDAATSVGTTNATLNGTVNANNATTTLGFDYGITDSYGSTATPTPVSASGMSNTALSSALSGLLPNQTYHYRVVANSSGGTTYGADMTFTTAAAAPVATTDAASGIGTTTATLNATVNANHSQTAVTFEYGMTGSYGSDAPAAQTPVTGTSGTVVSAALSELLPNQIYHYRVKTVNAGGTTYGADMTFTTAAAVPTAVTDAASSIGTTEATLNGMVNARNAEATVIFEYGATGSYGSSVTAAQSPFNGIASTAVNAGLTGLLPNQIYHYRVVATNAGGTTYGSDMTFTTAMTTPMIQTDPITQIGAKTATLHGVLTSLGAPNAIDHGFVWSASGTPTLKDESHSLGAPSAIGPFSANIGDLAQNTLFSVRAFAINAADTVYGAAQLFTTLAPHIVLKCGVQEIQTDSVFHMGTCPQKHQTDTTLTFYNSGNATLTLSLPIQMSGADTNQFSVLSQPDAVIAPGDSSSFNVRFSPSFIGDMEIALSIENSDEDMTPFQWSMAGYGGQNKPEIHHLGGDTLIYAEGDEPVQISSTVEVYDLDETSIHNAIVYFHNSYVPGEDVLDGESETLQVEFDVAKGVLQFSGPADFDTYARALRSVTYKNINTVAPDTRQRILAMAVRDECFYSKNRYKYLKVLAVNDSPELRGIESDTLVYSSNDESLRLTSSLVVSDSDDVFLNRAEIRISQGYVRGEDVLSFQGGGVESSFDTRTGTLTLSGEADVEAYQTALRQVFYKNRMPDDPSRHKREIQFTVVDGDSACALAIRYLGMAVAKANPGPYLRYCFPPDEGHGVPKNSSIQFRVMDDRAGINLETLLVRVNGNAIVRSGQDVTGGSVRILHHDTDTPQYTMIFENDTLYHPGDTVSVHVSCSDLRLPPRSMAAHYQFFIGQDSASYSESQPIGPEGGDFVDPETDIQMIVPQEALRDTFDIRVATVTETPALPDTVEGLTLSWHFSPEGLQFADSVEISIPWTPEMLDSAGVDNPMDLELYYFSTSTGEWQLLEIMDENEGRVFVRVAEFCYLSVRRDPLLSNVSSLGGVVPKAFDLHPAYPNPFNPETHLAFDLPRSSRVKLEIFDLRGRRVRQLVDETRIAGRYEVIWDSRDERGHRVSSGLYFVRIKCDDFTRSHKITLLK